MLKLYDSPSSPFCRRVRIALAEKGLHYERISVDLGKKENRRPEYLKMNPYGKVPVLVDGDATVYESAIINEYLDEQHPDPPLMPKDPALRARVRILVDYCDQHFAGPLRALRLELQKPEGDRDRAVIAEAEGRIKSSLQWLDEEIGGKEYLVGAFSLADVAFMPRVGTLEQAKIQIDPSLIRVMRWIDRVRSRKSFAA